MSATLGIQSHPVDPGTVMNNWWPTPAARTNSVSSPTTLSVDAEGGTVASGFGGSPHPTIDAPMPVAKQTANARMLHLGRLNERLIGVLNGSRAVVSRSSSNLWLIPSIQRHRSYVGTSITHRTGRAKCRPRGGPARREVAPCQRRRSPVRRTQLLGTSIVEPLIMSGARRSLYGALSTPDRPHH